MYVRLLKCMAVVATFGLFSLAAATAAQDGLEKLMWELVSTSNDASSVEAFIQQYPDSVRIDEAHSMLARLQQKSDAESMEDEIFRFVGAVTYTSPLAFGNERLIGQSLSQIIDSHPEYPPIAGLPEEIWKEQSCRSCHNWTREDLCVRQTPMLQWTPKSIEGRCILLGDY